MCRIVDRQNATGDLQAIGRVDVQTGDLLWRFSVHPQQLDDQVWLVTRRDPNHSFFHPDTGAEIRLDLQTIFYLCPRQTSSQIPVEQTFLPVMLTII